MNDRIELDDRQFDLQLELEDLDLSQLRELGEQFKARAHRSAFDQSRRFDVALRVLLALKRTPSLDTFEAEDRFAVWCDGFGVAVDDFYKDISAMIQRRSKPGEKKA
jgi:hypothetical protein